MSVEKAVGPTAVDVSLSLVAMMWTVQEFGFIWRDYEVSCFVKIPFNFCFVAGSSRAVNSWAHLMRRRKM